MLSPIARTDPTLLLVIMVKYIDGETLFGRRDYSGEVPAAQQPLLMAGSTFVQRGYRVHIGLVKFSASIFSRPDDVPGAVNVLPIRSRCRLTLYQTKEPDSLSRSSRTLLRCVDGRRRQSECSLQEIQSLMPAEVKKTIRSIHRRDNRFTRQRLVVEDVDISPKAAKI